MKSKLILFFIILAISLKLIGVLSWSWFLILSPFYILFGAFSLTILILIILSAYIDDKKDE